MDWIRIHNVAILLVVNFLFNKFEKNLHFSSSLFFSPAYMASGGQFVKVTIFRLNFDDFDRKIIFFQ